MLSFQELIVSKLMNNIVSIDQFFISSCLLSIICSKLARLYSLYLQYDSQSWISLFSIDIEMPFDSLTSQVKFFIKIDCKFNTRLAIPHVIIQIQIRIFIRRRLMSIQKQRAASRSIIIDPVQQKILMKRYHQHQDILSRIANTNHSDNFSQFKNHYLLQIQKYKRSTSQVKFKTDSKTLENQILIKHMMEIDRRKSSWKEKEKKLPHVHQNNKKQRQLRKQNEKLVERIIKQRIPRSKQQFIQADLKHQQYLQNLRKVKLKPSASAYLKIIR